MQVGLREVWLRVAGGLPADGARQRIGAMDIAAAQWLLGRQGSLTRIDLKLRPGATWLRSNGCMRGALASGCATSERPQASRALNRQPDARVSREPECACARRAVHRWAAGVLDAGAEGSAPSRATRVAARARGYAPRRGARCCLQRARWSGAGRRDADCAAGYALAAGSCDSVGADLGAGHFRGLTAAPAIEPMGARRVLRARCGGRHARQPDAGAGSRTHAAGAAHSRPETTRERSSPAAPLGPGAVVVAPGGLSPAASRGRSDCRCSAMLAIALLLIGTIMLMPRLMTMVLCAACPRRRARARAGPAAARPTRRAQPLQPDRDRGCSTLTVSMAIMVASFRQSLEDWLDRVLPADLYVRAGGFSDTAFLSERRPARIAATPGLRRVEFLRSQQIMLDPARPRVTLLARELDPANPQGPGAAGGAAAHAGARRAAAGMGQRVDGRRLRFFSGAAIELPVAGKSHCLYRGGGMARLRAAERRGVDPAEPLRSADRRCQRQRCGMWLQPGVTPEEMEARVRAAVPKAVPDWRSRSPARSARSACTSSIVPSP